MATPPWMKKSISWRAVRFGVLALAIYFGSFHKTGLFTHNGNEIRLPKRYEGCEGGGLYSNDTCRATCAAQANDTSWAPLPANILREAQSCHWCKEWTGGDTIFDHIVAMHDGLSLNSALDAGTGTTSLHWMAKDLNPKQWTAVTASQRNHDEVKTAKMKKRMRDGDDIIVGNWQNTSFLKGETYDLILADYLLGAVDSHAAFFQEDLFHRLKQHMAPNGRLYVVGKDPVPHPRRFVYADKASYNIYHGVHQVEDVDHLVRACMNHASHRAYREYPLSWVVQQAEKAGLKVESQVAFPVVHGPKSLHAQLDLCMDKLDGIEGLGLQNGIKARVAQLRERIDQNAMIVNNGVCYGVDYVVTLSAAK